MQDPRIEWGRLAHSSVSDDITEVAMNDMHVAFCSSFFAILALISHSMQRPASWTSVPAKKFLDGLFNMPWPGFALLLVIGMLLKYFQELGLLWALQLTRGFRQLPLTSVGCLARLMGQDHCQRTYAQKLASWVRLPWWQPCGWEACSGWHLCVRPGSGWIWKEPCDDLTINTGATQHTTQFASAIISLSWQYFLCVLHLDAWLIIPQTGFS